MFIRRRRLCFVFLALLPLCFAYLCEADPGTNGDAMPKAIRDKTVTYRFTARIKTNDGVTPFKAGDTIQGTFTYDLDSKDKYPDKPQHGFYKSPRNTFSFQLGNLRFSGVGDIVVTTGAFEHAEHFQIVAFDLKLPEGWEMDHTGKSQSYGIILQNAPATGAVANDGIPNRVNLSSFSSTRELRLDFYHGVRFPGGQVNRRATVYTTVEKLEEMNP